MVLGHGYFMFPVIPGCVNACVLKEFVLVKKKNKNNKKTVLPKVVISVLKVC